MNPQVQQAYEVLASLEQDLQNLYSKVKTVYQLLQVPQIQQQSPMGQQQAAMHQAGAQQGQTKIDVAIWERPTQPDKASMVSGVIKFNDVEYGLAMFQSKPNDKGMIFNGYVLPKESDPSVPYSEKKVGGAFIYNNPNGLSLSFVMDESPLVNKYNGNVPLQRNHLKQEGDNKPSVVGGVTVPHTIVKDVNEVLTSQGIHLPAQPSQPADPMQSALARFFSGNGRGQQPQQQDLGNPQDYNNLNNLIANQQTQQQQPPTQGGSILGGLLE